MSIKIISKDEKRITLEVTIDFNNLSSMKK